MGTRKAAALLAAVSLAIGACAPVDATDNEPLLKGPPVQDVVSPYHAALVCLRSQLTPEEQHVSFGVLDFPDLTGKFNLAQGGAGSFSTQGGADRLITALHTIGVRVVQTDPKYLGLVDWYLSRGGVGMFGDGQIHYIHIPQKDGSVRIEPSKTIPVVMGTFEPANIVISGAITAADFLPGEGGEVSVAGIGGGYREYRMLIGMDAKATRMPVGSELGGSVVATTHVSKQIVAYEFKLGIASFFGGPNYTDVNAGKDGREALQFSEGFMTDYVAYRLVSEAFGITACEPQVEYAEGKLVPNQQKDEATTPPPKAATDKPAAMPHPGERGDLNDGKQQVAETGKKTP